jgi:hypothetical protein
MTNSQPKREKTQKKIKAKVKREILATNANEIHRIIRKFFEHLCSNNLKDLEEMDTFLDTNNLPKLNQKNINNISRSVTSSEVEGK